MSELSKHYYVNEMGLQKDASSKKMGCHILVSSIMPYFRNYKMYLRPCLCESYLICGNPFNMF